MTREPFAQLLARNLREWFPQLEGRAVAITESEPFSQDSMPTLPLAVVGVLEEEYSGSDSVRTVYSVEFMFNPSRYNLAAGGESPFWTYFDYEPLRDTLADRISSLGKLRLLRMTMDSDPGAVYISFRISRESRWCPPEPEETCPKSGDGQGLEISIRATPRPWLCCNTPDKEGKNDC